MIMIIIVTTNSVTQIVTVTVRSYAMNNKGVIKAYRFKFLLE